MYKKSEHSQKIKLKNLSRESTQPIIKVIGVKAAEWKIIKIIIIIKTSSTGQRVKNKIVYKLLTQPHKHLHHEKQKNKLREETNDWLLP